jgi:hypothetical protein
MERWHYGGKKGKGSKTGERVEKGRREVSEKY